MAVVDKPVRSTSRRRRGKPGPRVTVLTDEILDRIGMYVLGNVATSAVAGVAAALVLWLLDVPYPIALGVFVALMDVVPLVGATIGAFVSSAMAFTVSAGTGIAAIAFFVAYQQFENFVLVPVSCGRRSMSHRRPRSWPSSSAARCSASSARCSPYRRPRPSSSCAPRWSCRARSSPDHRAAAEPGGGCYSSRVTKSPVSDGVRRVRDRGDP